MCAASANSFNQIFERNLDKKMKRTCNRPLPSGKLPVGEAVSFGVLAGAAGVTTLFTLTNPVVAALGGANIFLYAGPYTFMKRYSEANTWIGSVVGAIPPVMVGIKQYYRIIPRVMSNDVVRVWQRLQGVILCLAMRRLLRASCFCGNSPISLHCRGCTETITAAGASKWCLSTTHRETALPT